MLILYMGAAHVRGMRSSEHSNMLFVVGEVATIPRRLQRLIFCHIDPVWSYELFYS